MSILTAIKEAEGPFMVLTAGGVRGFADFEECEKFVESLGGCDFAVIRLLWAGGESKETTDQVLPANAVGFDYGPTLAMFKRESLPRKPLPSQVEVEREPITLSPIESLPRKPLP
jgi:hypothetical protein